jgi:AmiR/NasT family two-component response regulator
MRILIADDEPFVGLGLAARVRSLGLEPLGPVPDGEDAVAAARSDPPDVYVFDIEMPNVDGLDAATRLTELGLRRPVVIVTGHEEPELLERAIASGVGAYLRKPVETPELEAAIRIAVARHGELVALEAEVTRAQQALEDRKVVERAKGLLMSTLEVSEQTAFRRIQLAARERNLRLVEVARRIVDHEDLLTTARRSR